MAAGWAILGSALIGGIGSFLGGNAQQQAADTAANISNDQYLQTRADLTPWRNSGTAALSQINALLGLGGSGPTGTNPATAPANAFATSTPVVGKLYPNQSSRGNTPLQDIQQALAKGIPVSDYSWAQAGFGPGGAGYFPTTPSPATAASGAASNPISAQQAQKNAFALFQTDPGYQFALDQGLKTLQNSAAARGVLNSGATAKAITDYGQGMANQQYGNYFARLQSLAGLGQTATNTTAQAGSAAASNAGNALMAGGNARASAYGGIAGSANQGIGNYLFANMYGGGGGVPDSVYTTPQIFGTGF